MPDRLTGWTRRPEALADFRSPLVGYGAGISSAPSMQAVHGRQSLFGVSLLMRMRFGPGSAMALAALFSVQIVLAFIYRDDAAQAIASLTMRSWVYLALAAVILMSGTPSAWRAVSALR